MLFVFLFWAMLVALCGIVGHRKGYSAYGCVALAILVTIVGGAAAVALGDDSDVQLANFDRRLTGRPEVPPPFWSTTAGISLLILFLPFAQLMITAALPIKKP